MARLTPIHFRKLTKVFEKEGWILVGQSGDHLEYKKPGFKRRVVIPRYKDVPLFVVENNLRTAGISRKRYFELLRKV